eukprot:GDKI01028862.1.p1 GENE.GDKI01028862.1~~GDKI01028862.1.p1  ORF type:complete len:269 (-),score=61.14 GDKI01028862.1:149-859(-)
METVKSRCEIKVNEWEDKGAALKRTVETLQERLDASERRVSTLHHEQRQLESTIRQLTDERNKLTKEVSDLHGATRDAFETERAALLQQLAGMERRLASSAERHKRTEQQALELIMAQEGLRARWTAEFNREKQYLESQLSRSRHETRKLQDSVQQMARIMAAHGLPGDAVSIIDQEMPSLGGGTGGGIGMIGVLPVADETAITGGELLHVTTSPIRVAASPFPESPRRGGGMGLN